MTSTVISGSTGITFPDQTVMNSSYGLTMKNRLINGDMQVDQRQNGGSTTILSGNYGYTIDRWAVTSSNASCVCQQVSGSGSNTFQYALQLQPSISSNSQTLSQRIESIYCDDLAGKIVTVSGQIYIDSNTGVSTYVGIKTANSVDGSYTNSLGNQLINLTSNTYNYFTQTFTLPNTAVNGVELDLIWTNAPSKTIKVTGMQLEIGNTATSFQKRGYSNELNFCERYFQSFYSTGGVAISNTAAHFHHDYKQVMRTNPSLIGNGNVHVSDYQTDFYSSSFSPTFINYLPTGARFSFSGFTTLPSSTYLILAGTTNPPYYFGLDSDL